VRPHAVAHHRPRAHRTCPPRGRLPVRWSAVTGGRNGYGAKLANIFSTQFTVEAADGVNGKRFMQTFSANMTTKTEPAITAYSGPDYTCITFKPDLPRFGMAGLDDDIVDLLSKRVYDMAGVLGKAVAVSLNGSRIPIASFAEYVALYDTEDAPAPAAAGAGAGAGAAPGTGVRIWERMSDRWEVCLTLSDGTFNHVSFVNSICTYKVRPCARVTAAAVAGAVLIEPGTRSRPADLAASPRRAANTSPSSPTRSRRRWRRRRTRRTRAWT